MIEDISKSIKASMYERVTSPLFGAFIISWSLWNYKTILVILSSLDVKEKISFIENNLYQDQLSVLLLAFTYPLLSSVCFILIYPYPAKWIYEYWNKKQKELKEIKQEIEDETPLTQEQYRKVKRDLSRLESNYHEEIVSKINEIDQLNKIIEESSSKDHVDFNKIKANISGKKEIVSELDENLRDVLVYVSQHQEEDSAFVDVYYQKSKFSKLKAEYYLESLVEKEYIKQTFGEDPFDPPLFSLTAKGRKFLVEHDLVP